jgi:hypothetical protein
MRDRPAALARLLQHSARAFNGCTYIAAAELRWIGESNDEIDDHQSKGVEQAQARHRSPALHRALCRYLPTLLARL